MKNVIDHGPRYDSIAFQDIQFSNKLSSFLKKENCKKEMVPISTKQRNHDTNKICSGCSCICDEDSSDSDRYFSLNDATSDIESD